MKPLYQMAKSYSQSFRIRGQDFQNAGKASTGLKSILTQIGIDADVIRRTAIAAYEAEMNVVMYAQEGMMTVEIDSAGIRISVEDRGPGISDINLAMREGYSTATNEMREMGFGAGMGLPNIRKNADAFRLESTVGVGTHLEVIISIN
jgi:anti-sigma regulatory factor (Ser/Thr protein kinase)